jgi:hypothetical protein
MLLLRNIVLWVILITILDGLPIQSQDCGMTAYDICQLIMYKGKNKSNQLFGPTYIRFLCMFISYDCDLNQNLAAAAVVGQPIKQV